MNSLFPALALTLFTVTALALVARIAQLGRDLRIARGSLALAQIEIDELHAQIPEQTVEQLAERILSAPAAGDA